MPQLPHLYPIGACFFITFRLADSLPQNLITQYKSEYTNQKNLILKRKLNKQDEKKSLYKLRKKTFGKYDAQLDNYPYGKCQLSDPKVAKILWDKIFQYNDLYYTVDAISIMPNHVHILVDTSIQIKQKVITDQIPEHYVDVPKWMQLIKGGSAHSINKHLNRKGKLWAKESYDHFVRLDEEGEYQRIVNYILQNPIKAGLPNHFTESPFLYHN